MDQQPPEWMDFEYTEAAALGATATAHDIAMRVWFNNGTKLRLCGRVTLQYKALSGEFRLAYYGQHVDFHTGDLLHSTLASSLLLPNPSEWVIPKAAKVAGQHTRARVMVMGFTSGAMFEKLQLVFKVADCNDHGKFFIKTIERIKRNSTGR
jgi:hypothetical protein